MRSVPSERNVSRHELECVGEGMDGYTQAAAEAVADHGDTITDTHGWALAAAYMQGAATMHAGETIAAQLQGVVCQLERIADEQERQSIAAARLHNSVAMLADAVQRHGDVVSAAIEVHSESTDRLADAVETRAP